MRRIMILATGAVLILTTAATAQHEPPVQPPSTAPAPTAPEASAPAATIKSVTIVDIEQLPEATQTRVDSVVAQTSEADIKALRQSLDTMPQIKSALEAKGLTSANVIAANVAGDGALTLVTKKAS